jgi:hypothetical protein
LLEGIVSLYKSGALMLGTMFACGGEGALPQPLAAGGVVLELRPLASEIRAKEPLPVTVAVENRSTSATAIERHLLDGIGHEKGTSLILAPHHNDIYGYPCATSQNQ